MQEVEIELGIGDVVQIGDVFYTVIDIEGGEVVFRVDSNEPIESLLESVPAQAR